MRGELSPLTIGLLAFVSSLCVTPLEYPGFWLASLGPLAVLAPIGATAVGLLGTTVAMRFSGTRPWERGGPGVRFLAVALAPVVLFGAAANTEVYAQASASVFTVHFPLYYPVAFVGVASAVAAYYGVVSVARTISVLFPLVATGLVLLFAAPIGNIDLRNLVGPQPAFQPTLDGMTIASLGAVRGFLVLLVWGGRARNGRAATRAALLGVAGAGLLVVVSTVWPLAIFGLPEALTLRFPLLAVTGSVFWQWFPSSSFEALTMVVWQVVAFLVVAEYIALGADVLRLAVPSLGRLPAFALAVLPVALASVQMRPGAQAAALVAFNALAVAVGLALPAGLLLAGRRPADGPEAAGVT